MIQFFNIAGLGPIFGAIAGAMFGPAAFLWIVLGSIFACGVHNYLSGMLSVRHNGFFNVTELNVTMMVNDNNAAWAAKEISLNMLGGIGGILVLLGLAAAPITSEDSAFRSVRLILLDLFKSDQKKNRKQPSCKFSFVYYCL